MLEKLRKIEDDIVELRKLMETEIEVDKMWSYDDIMGRMIKAHSNCGGSATHVIHAVIEYLKLNFKFPEKL